MNLKAAIALAVELTINTEIPESTSDYIKLALKIVMELYCLSCVHLCKEACVILLYLHKKDAYVKGISEQQFFDDISSGIINITKNEYIVAISQLDKMSTVAVKDGLVYLKEKVTLKY